MRSIIHFSRRLNLRSYYYISKSGEEEIDFSQYTNEGNKEEQIRMNTVLNEYKQGMVFL